MKWLLVDNYDTIRGKVNAVDKDGAKIYFMERKQIDEEGFDTLWKVLSEEDYECRHRASFMNKQYEWWKEDKAIVDDELKI